MSGATSESAIAAFYKSKPAAYFANARSDIVEALTTGPGCAILELGCGAGGTGRLAMSLGKAGRYVGIELSEAAAAKAAEVLTQVVVGDVESLNLESLAGKFDALIISEVLEHLADPWTTLSRLAACVRAGGEVYASSPNIAHWKVITNLLMGRFVYEERGVMDRTHLRWFTPASYAAMFEQAGIEVLSIQPVTTMQPKAKAINALTGGRFRHLFITQIMIRGRKRP